MIVLSVTNCPQQLRGDLTKWFIEIDTGIYVGKLNARVRGKIWERVCDNIKSGQAIMVYSTNNEQGFSIVTHNTKWKPIDCEGVLFMQKPVGLEEENRPVELKEGFSKAARRAFSRCRMQVKKKTYVILDIETTGLDCTEDRIIELGMLKVEDGNIREEYHGLINPNRKIPEDIVRLTGITEEMILQNGIDEEVALKEAKAFIGDNLVIGYNVEFDLSFIREMCRRHSEELFICKAQDMLRSVKRKLNLDNYRLETVAKSCKVDTSNMHRAIEDCRILYGVNCELNIF